MKALILAGGFATRLWPLTESRAKPLLYLNGKTILAHILEKIPETTETILCINQKFEADFKNELKKYPRSNIKIFCEDAFSDGEKLGALGAISKVISEYQIKEDILICAGDNILPELEIEKLIPHEDAAHIACREVETLYEAQKFGVLEINKNTNQVINFEEKPESPKSKLVATGFLSIGKNNLSLLQDYAKKEPDALGGIFPELLNQGKKVKAIPTKGEWFDVGSFESYLSAHKKLQKEAVKIEKKTQSKQNKFQGKVWIGEGCNISHSTLIDCIVYPNTTLKNCVMSSCVIDQNCHFENLDLNQKLIRKNTKLIG